MHFSKSQLIIISITFLIVTLFTLVLIGVIPGLRQDLGPATQITIWGVHDDAKDFSGGISRLKSVYPSVQVSYIKKDPATYETEILNALALGKGPDIIMISNSDLPKYGDKLTPAPINLIDIKTIEDKFPLVIKNDLVSQNNIYALPLYLDTLALFYNEDIFNTNNIIEAPKTWDEFTTLSNNLKKIDRSNKIERAGSALGGSVASISRVSDIISALMLQSGTKMLSENTTRAIFAEFSQNNINPGREAVDFYSSFSNPGHKNFTWQDDFVNAIDGFSDGRVAMIIDYSYQSEIIKNKNPFLNFKTARLPQLDINTTPVNYADYQALAVLKQSQNKNTAWQVVYNLTLDNISADSYAKSSVRPPALRSLLESCQRDINLSAFCEQSLTSRSWYQIDKNKISLIFSDMIKNITSGKLSAKASIEQAQDLVTSLMSQ